MISMLKTLMDGMLCGLSSICSKMFIMNLGGCIRINIMLDLQYFDLLCT